MNEIHKQDSYEIWRQRVVRLQAEIGELAEFLTDVADHYDCRWVAVVALIDKYKQEKE